MNCYICGSNKKEKILERGATPLWNNAADTFRKNNGAYPCTIFQCLQCGHVYQPVGPEQREALSKLYKSENSQLSTPMGRGNWGKARAQRAINAIEKCVDLRNVRSLLEIGCGDGYLLEKLKIQFGVNELFGVEPSLDDDWARDGISLSKEFLNESTKISRKYDLIVSFGVFEHLEDIAAILRFCHKSLSSNGKIYFSVPDSKNFLMMGDPALFVHQHIHYFTEETIMYLLGSERFEVEGITSSGDTLNVVAKPGVGNIDCIHVEIYSDYDEKLEKIIAGFKNALQSGGLIIHGASNSLHNMLSWVDGDFNYVLVDGDETKQGNRYFGEIVKKMENVKLEDYKKVIVIPSNFYDEIKDGYIKAGFKGVIDPVVGLI